MERRAAANTWQHDLADLGRLLADEWPSNREGLAAAGGSYLH